ncbi:MAG: hypothetical protein WC905_03205 [Patescibacteria group bacterium]|jgi:hypothetical protein
MFNGESLSLWPESTGGGPAKKPIKDDSFKPEDDGAEIKEEEEKSQENYRPDAAGILARLKTTPPTDPEEIRRRQAEYFKKVYSGEKAKPDDVAMIAARIRRNNEEQRLNPDKGADISKTGIAKTKEIEEFEDNDQDDPWHDINPPAMFLSHRFKKKK